MRPEEEASDPARVMVVFSLCGSVFLHKTCLAAVMSEKVLQEKEACPKSGFPAAEELKDGSLLQRIAFF